MTETIIEKNIGCPPESCDTFQFMAKEIGLNVLHPGGLKETRSLLKHCRIKPDSKILDLGCGKGSTSILLAETYGCYVVGVDIEDELLEAARTKARRKKLDGLIDFRHADIENLPFQNDYFDGAISQAVLIFTDKDKTLHEIVRVVKQGGFFGAIELSWKQNPTEYIASRVRETLCSVSVDADLHTGWIYRLQKAGLTITHEELKNMRFTMIDTIRDEGLINSLRVLRSYLKTKARERLRSFSRLFKETEKYLGYGIYIGRVK